MPSYTRPTAPKEITSDVRVARRAYSSRSVWSLRATACAVQMDGDGTTGEQELAAKLPPGGGGDTKPPIDWPSVLNQLVEISAGKDHTCVRKLNGNVYCWGLTSYGQAGPANTTCLSGYPCVTQPQSVGIKALQVDLGYDHSCVVDRFGSGLCWGANHNAQLGNGSVVITPNLPASSQPVAFNGSRSSFRASAPDRSPAAASKPAPARSSAGEWPGRADIRRAPAFRRPTRSGTAEGSCSTGSTRSPPRTPAPASRSTSPTAPERRTTASSGPTRTGNSNLVSAFDQSAVRISTQSTFTCADKTNGTVECFGYGGEGQLGDGAQTNSSTSVLVGAACRCTA